MRRIAVAILIVLAFALLGRLPATLRSAPLAITTTPTKPRLNLPLVADARPSSTPTATRTPGSSPTPTSTPRPGALVIDDVILADPAYPDSEEFVQIRNADNRGFDLVGWRLINATRSSVPPFVFPGFVLEANFTLAVYSQVGNDDLDVGDFYWDQTNSVWNIGDRVELRDAQGRLIHSFIVPEQ